MLDDQEPEKTLKKRSVRKMGLVLKMKKGHRMKEIVTYRRALRI